MVINYYLQKSNRLLFIGFSLILAVLTCMIITSIPLGDSLSNNEVIDKLKEGGIFTFFIIATIIVPIVETLIFQYLPIKVTQLVLKNKKQKFQELWSIIISSILFSLIHCYSFVYIVLAFILGIIFAFSFIISQKRKENPLINVIIIHSIYNVIIFIIDLVSN